MRPALYYTSRRLLWAVPYCFIAVLNVTLLQSIAADKYGGLMGGWVISGRTFMLCLAFIVFGSVWVAQRKCE